MQGFFTERRVLLPLLLLLLLLLLPLLLLVLLLLLLRPPLLLLLLLPLLLTVLMRHAVTRRARARLPECTSYSLLPAFDIADDPSNQHRNCRIAQ